MSNNKFASFGEWLRSKIKEKDISNAELARRIDVSATYIGNLLRDFSPNSKTGSIRASEKIVEAIAKELNSDIDEARNAAGYASKNADEIPPEIAAVGFKELSPDDIKNVARYMKFLISEK